MNLTIFTSMYYLTSCGENKGINFKRELGDNEVLIPIFMIIKGYIYIFFVEVNNRTR